MSVWDWVHEFRERAREAGDEERVRMSRLHNQAYELRETNPDRALAIYEEGSRLARVLEEAWWVLFYDHWRVVAMLFFQRDYSNVLDLAVRNSLEVRKPQFENFPERISIHRSLISAYIGIDPAGHAQDIIEALDYLEKLADEVGEDKYLVLGSKAAFALEMGRVDEAEAILLHSLRLADQDKDRSGAEHSSVFDYSDLCDVAWRKRDWKALDEYTREGEKVARRRDLQMQLCEFLMWEAVLRAHEGDTEKSLYLHRRALSRAGRLRMPPTETFFDAHTAWHTLREDLTQALAVREGQLKMLAGKGRFITLCRCRTRMARLLARLGLPIDEQMAAAREVAQKLRDPSPHLAELDRIAAGDASGEI
jgi:hypothetical protein